MDRERIEELWSRFLSNDPLSASEERELLEALDSDPSLRQELLKEARLDGWLTTRASTLRDPEAPVRKFLKRVGAERDATGFIRKVESRLEATRPPTRRHAWRRLSGKPSGWTVGLAAAGLVLGVAALLAALSSKPVAPARPQVARPLPAREDSKARAEAELREIERERQKLVAGPQTPVEKPSLTQEEERKKSLAVLDDRKRRIEEEMKAAIERERAPLTGILPSDRPKPAPAPELPPSVKPPAAPTEAAKAALVSVAKVEGEVHLVGDGEKKPVTAGQVLSAGQGIVTGGGASAIEIAYPDQTRLELGPDTLVKDLRGDHGKRLFMEKGRIRAEVKPQPSGQHLVIETPHAAATVLGTTLKIFVDSDPGSGTRLEVTEGRVRLTRKSDQKSVEVTSGHFAVAATGVDLVVKPMPLDDIVLRAKEARLFGSEWQLVKDPEAFSGSALEALAAARKAPQRLAEAPCVVFGFRADADRDYTVWIRGRTLGKTSERRGDFIYSGSDAVVIEVLTGVVTNAGDGAKSNFTLESSNRAVYDGFVVRAGYWWSGGDANVGHQERRDEIPVTVRFQRAGPQALKIYAFEVPMRIDSIWLSTTQKSRPASDQSGPGPVSK